MRSSGVTVVATSNTAPDDLYENGLNRQLVLPFIADLKAHVDIVPLDESLLVETRIPPHLIDRVALGLAAWLPLRSLLTAVASLSVAFGGLAYWMR